MQRRNAPDARNGRLHFSTKISDAFSTKYKFMEVNFVTFPAFHVDNDVVNKFLILFCKAGKPVRNSRPKQFFPVI